MRRSGRHARPAPRRRPLPWVAGALALAAAALAVLLAAATLPYLRGPAGPPPPKLVPAVPVAAAAAADRASYSGRWIVQRGPGTFLGYRVRARVAGRPVPTEIVGRTQAVSGLLQLSGAHLEGADVLAELATLSSGNPRRDDYLRVHALQSQVYSTARFQLSSSVPLPGTPRPGRVVPVQAPGTLMVHGRTRTVTFSLEGRWQGDTLEVVGRGRIRLADFAIARPRVAGVLSVGEHAIVEVRLRLRRA